MRLHRHKFRRWLEEKSPTEIVGKQRDCHACPIADFYYEASRGCEVVISDSCGFGYMIDRGYSERRLPAWADAFVFLVDGEDAPQVSAARALELLGQIAA